MMYEYAKTSLVNDKSRVIKGGSWRDRAYFLNPGTRRYLDQRQANAWLGFRCAMTRVGSPVGMGK
jgi:formylglycine-generating enzyme required for sulfatase activity